MPSASLVSWPSPRPSSASPRPPRKPKSSRLPNTDTAWSYPRAAGTTRGPARSTPSALPTSMRRRAWPPAPPLRWCWRSASRPCRPTPARRPPSWPSATARPIQGGAGGGCVRRIRPGQGQGRQPQAGSRRRRESCTRPPSPAPRSSSSRSASAAPRCSFVIAPGLRYRLMARALVEDFEKRKEAVDAFFASFRMMPEGR